ncbi:MAG TPA: hypothetical protein PLJ42_09305 [Chitinophagales bacterium]|jgi:drug/metabolite transporter (DMT)-like permease|nr:hypothetical protein [Chitinophagales bacterium]HQV77555.1 hypothetical protein [Chitinophagales bacterium]HQW79620.1 hypothetical protein [Chitinophagales bacterium]HRB66963.1 hypothetical protein [Chitinophagales bacterium]HRB92559.1 hypothetical protein [Chitinophagales bacterium]
MIYLILSIFFATSLVVILRYFNKWNIHPTYGIVFNYIFCVITGLFFVDDFTIFKQMPSWKGFPFNIGLGIAFILVFLLVGKTTQLFGVLTASIAMKLSFVIPVVMAIFFYNDSVNLIKIGGIVAAFAAVVLITYERKSKKINTGNKSKLTPFFPFLIFIGSGFCDATFDYIQNNIPNASWSHPITIVVFAGACSFGLLLNIGKRDLYQWKNVAGGIILGIPNYFSLYFLLKTLDTLTWQSSIIFPINNLGIVGLSAIAGVALFQEKMNTQKIIGFILAISSIILIGFLS